MKHLSLALFLFVCSTINSRAQAPAQISVDHTTTPEVVQVLDDTNTWVPIGTLDSNGHTFNPIGRPVFSLPFNYGIYQASVITPGSAAVPGDVITPNVPNSMTVVTDAKLTVIGTEVVSVTSGSNGTGCTAGTYTVNGTTGTSQRHSLPNSGRFQASITVASNQNVSINSIVSAGQYSVNPSSLSSEPITGVTGCSVQPTLVLTMGVAYLQVSGATQPGLYSAVANSSATITIKSSTGSEIGMTATVYFAPIAAQTYPANQAPGGGANTGIWETAYGFNALSSLTTGGENNGYGWEAGGSLTTGSWNTFVGSGSGWVETTGNGNVGVGSDSMRNVQSGSTDNTAVGQGAQRNGIGVTGNTALGYGVLQGNESGGSIESYMTAVGWGAMQGLSMSTAAFDTCVGVFCLKSLTTGDANTGIGLDTLESVTTGWWNDAIGYQVGSTVLTTGSRNILIGTASNCDADSSAQNDTFKLCASSGATPLLKGNLAAASLKLTVNGPVQLPAMDIANLPACASGTVGEVAFVDNGIASPTYHLAASTTGTAEWPVFCTYNGTTYAWVY